ncbi:MAG: thermonuclease family protein [Sphingomonadales bacterium]|jgi:micrococcal nuclease|nr:thermonuclease family protein [Sphingomonadales bacterium]
MIKHPLLQRFAVAFIILSPITAPAALSSPPINPRFGYCFRGGGTNCVVDGDTFWIDGEKVRIADIDAPETHPSRCREEKALGEAATERLHALLNAGSFELTSISRDTDRYGRKLRVVVRHGFSIGKELVTEGLAREWDGARHPWCV